MNEDENEPQQH